MATAQEDKLKALQLTIEKVEKQYGKGSIMKLGDSRVVDIETISTGSLGLDLALGIGGLPKGRIIEIYGPESSGKTTLAIHAIAEAQKKGGIAAIIDAEHAFDKTYAKALGVDVDNLLISQPDDGEQGLDIAEHLIRSGAVDIVVIDSVAALVPRGEIEGDMGDSKMGLQARLMSQAMRKLTGSIHNKEGDIIGNQTKVKVVKNKLSPPFKTVEFDIIYGKGISKEGEIVDQAVELNIFSKSGTWYSYETTKLGQGRDSVKQLLLDNPEMMMEVEQKIKAKLANA